MSTESELDEKILDLTEEWHDAVAGDVAHSLHLVDFIAGRLGMTKSQVEYELYGNRSDGALL